MKIEQHEYQSMPEHLQALFAPLPNHGSDEVVRLFPYSTSGAMNGTYKNTIMANKAGTRDGEEVHLRQVASKGSAARFFYCAKASKRDRDEGCEGMPPKKAFDGVHDNPARMNAKNREMNTDDTAPRKNGHPTVKPTDLMRYLVRLVTPPGGTVLDPYTGSGSTGKAAILEGFEFIGIELEPEYVEIAKARITHSVENTDDGDGTLDLFKEVR